MTAPSRFVRRHLRAVLFGAAGVAGISSACREGALPTEAGLRPAAIAALRIQAIVSTDGRTIKVVASYARAATPAVLIPLDSATITLSETDALVPVRLDIASCLADAGRELPADLPAIDAAGTCVLHLALSLFDASHREIDQAAPAPIVARPGQETAVPPVSLGTLVGTVALSPRTFTLNAIGFTKALVATVTDRQGAPIQSAPAYASLDPLVASVDAASGLVTARSVGAARITATSRDKADTASVTVRQVPSSLALSAVAVLLLDDSALVTAATYDSAGVPIPPADAPIQLFSSDASVLSIDTSTSRMHAVGVGTAFVRAVVGTLSGSLPVTVSPFPATHLAIATPPGGAVARRPLSPQPIIQVRDARENVVAASSVPVTATLNSAGGSLLGTTTVNAVNGIATFTDLAVSAEGGFTLTFTSGGLAPAISMPVSILEPPPPSIGLNVGSSAAVSGVVGSDLAIPVIADMSNAHGQNIASLSFSVAWDPARFTFVSATNGTFGTAGNYFVNTENVANGFIGVSVFDVEGFSIDAPTVFTVVLRPTAAGVGTVQAAVAAAGDVSGTTISSSKFVVRPLTVTVP